MMDVIHRERAFSDMFVAYLLTRNIRYEEDLIDQFFNSSEKRLARVLLLLAQFGKDGKHEVAIPEMSGDSGRDGRNDPIASQFLHEQVSEAGLCSL
jgi:CRP/FNR family transcriptional regulator, cyclic AMP receptor protein